MSAKFKVGDKVSLAKWDKTVRPVDAGVTGTVLTVIETANCESGTMVRVALPNGRQLEFDSGWLEVIP